MEPTKRQSFLDAKQKLEKLSPSTKYVLIEGNLAKWYGVEEGLYKLSPDGDFYDPRLEGVKWVDAATEREVY